MTSRPSRTPPARPRHRACWWLTCVLLAGGLCAVRPVAQSATDTEVKAAYLYNFGRFVEWPSEATGGAGGPLRMCVIGVDPFGPLLESAAAVGPLGGREVQPERVQAVADAQRCHVLFVSDSERERVDDVLAALKGSHVLTVSDMPQFVRRGGMIQFTRQGGRVRFEINLPAAQEASLVLSSDLLRVASAVRR